MLGAVFIEGDPFSPIRYMYQVSSIVYNGTSKYQHIAILDNPYFGRMLVLDNVVQLTTRDEFFYHEMLAHVILHAHIKPAHVLIIGGGDGGTLREVLKHRLVEEVQLVEIDRQVIEVSKRFLPEVAVGFSDPRVRVMETDGTHFVRETKKKYDVVIVDSTDPVGRAKDLFTERFFCDVLSVLNNEGMFVSQTESLHFHRQFVVDVQLKLGRVFESVGLYHVPLATYAGNWWTFSLGSRKYIPNEPSRRQEVSTKYYDEHVHRSAFIPESVKRRLLDGTLSW